MWWRKAVHSLEQGTRVTKSNTSPTCGINLDWFFLMHTFFLCVGMVLQLWGKLCNVSRFWDELLRSSIAMSFINSWHHCSDTPRWLADFLNTVNHTSLWITTIYQNHREVHFHSKATRKRKLCWSPQSLDLRGGQFSPEEDILAMGSRGLITAVKCFLWLWYWSETGLWTGFQ